MGSQALAAPPVATVMEINGFVPGGAAAQFAQGQLFLFLARSVKINRKCAIGFWKICSKKKHNANGKLWI